MSRAIRSTQTAMNKLHLTRKFCYKTIITFNPLRPKGSPIDE